MSGLEPGTSSVEARDTHIRGQTGWNFQAAFGRRSQIPNNSAAVIWGGTAAIRPLPLVPTQMAVRSNNAADAFGNPTGAQLVGVSFIDELGDWRMSDFVLMNGLTPVTITHNPNNLLNTQGGQFTFPGGSSVPAQIFRVLDVWVLTANGITVTTPFATNLGTISVVDDATKLIEFDAIRPNRGRAHTCAFHIPRNFRGRLTRAPVGSSSGTGTFFILASFGLETAFQSLPLCTVNASSSLFVNDPFTTPILPRSDLVMYIEVGANNTDAAAQMQVRLEPQL